MKNKKTVKWPPYFKNFIDELKKEILEQDTKIQEKQTEVLIKDETRNETVKKLENGTF